MAVFLALDCIIDEAPKALQFGCDLFAESNAMTKAGIFALGHEPVVGKADWLAD